MEKQKWTVEFLPIASAPVEHGVKFGPCLLGPAENGDDWIVGNWNGAEWRDSNGFVFAPLVYLLLEPLTEVSRRLGLSSRGS